MKKVILVACFALFLCTRVIAGGPGTTNANFLKAGQGVRPISMGETYTALGDGLDTLYWNPAGLVQMTSPAASFIHSFWVQDIGTEYLAYGMPMGPMGAIAGGLTYMHAGTIQTTLEDEFGNYAGTGGEASAMSIALVGAYSQKLSRLMPIKDPFFGKMLVGASLRIVTESIDEVSVFGGAIDIGAIWRDTEEISPNQIATASGVNKTSDGKTMVRDKGFRWGFVAQNLGMTSDQGMPINFRVGMGYVVQDLFSPTGRGTFAADVLIPNDNDLKISLGAEYANISPNTEFAARVGYKIGNEIKDLDSLAGLTAGVGFAIIGGVIKYQVDYAFVPYGDLGTTHRAALTLSFLPSSNVVKAAPMKKAVVAAPSFGAVSPELAGASKASKKTKVKAAKKKVKPVKEAKVEAKPVETEAVSAPVEEKPKVSAAAASTKKIKRDLRMLLKRVGAGMLSPIAFQKDSAKIKSTTKKSLDKLGKILEKRSEGNVVIVGYAGNAKLAQDRSKAVVRYLKMNFRVDADRLSTKAGETAEKPKKSSVSFEVIAPK
jgi:outer membrane protein OmpA-like peptidoglycan-associated protein